MISALTSTAPLRASGRIRAKGDEHHHREAEQGVEQDVGERHEAAVVARTERIELIHRGCS
jgi:hypothetical protein